MWKGALKVSIPNPHRGDIGRNLLAIILRGSHLIRADVVFSAAGDGVAVEIGVD